MNKLVIRHKELTTTQIIAFGFLGAIVVGTLLLMLPLSSSEGIWTKPIDALFTATTSVCVTGLTTVTTAEHWSIFGQIVILILIQMGGLGVVTFTTLLLLVASKRITLKERMLIRDAYNLNSLNGLVKLTKRIVKGTVIVEGIGALLYMPVFVRDKGIYGIFAAIFNSISAFCNAGMDLIGDSSLSVYRDNPIVNITTMLLIIIGGIGFYVWWDIIKVAEKKKKNKKIRMWNSFELHTKLVLVVTLLLIAGGALLIFILEYNNDNTMGGLGILQKIQASFFQSVTTRTAGFFTIPQENFTDASAFVSLILMFIGGSPAGTAGGVKTVTVALVLFTVISIIKNREETEIFGRSISSSNVRKGIAIIFISFGMLIISMSALSFAQGGDFLDSLFEVTSAIATVGLTRGMTTQLNDIGKMIIILTMYIGRIGPISLALFFNAGKGKEVNRRYPKGKILVG